MLKLQGEPWEAGDSLDDSVSQTGDDHQHPGQGPLHRREHLSKHHRPLDCRRTHYNVLIPRKRCARSAQKGPACVFAYLTSRRIWCSGTRRSKRPSPACPGRWLLRSRTGSGAGPSSNTPTEPTTTRPEARTRCTSPCRTGDAVLTLHDFHSLNGLVIFYIYIKFYIFTYYPLLPNIC